MMGYSEVYLDCGDNSCAFCPPEKKTGMRTNGGCRCLQGADQEERRTAQRQVISIRAQLQESQEQVRVLRERIAELESMPVDDYAEYQADLAKTEEGE